MSSSEVGFNYTATRDVRDLLGGKVFDFPKPIALIQQLCSQVTANDDIVLDYFAGSGSTAHAVVAQNASDGGRRRFILVQIAEPTDPKSEAAKSGYATIADVAKERIRRAAVEVSNEAGLTAERFDLGFRVLKIDTPNMADVLFTSDTLEQNELNSFITSVKADRFGEDLLFQVLLDWGLELTMPIRVEEIEGHEVFVVENDALIACFDTEVRAELVRAIAKWEPLRAVFRDSGFASDDARINAEQIFREISPATDVKAL
jgi:adenine-specific DNA-methyltransferase